MLVLRARLVYSTINCIGAVSTPLLQISGLSSAKQMLKHQAIVLQTTLYSRAKKASVTAMFKRQYVLFVVYYLVFQLLFQISSYRRNPELERDVSKASLLQKRSPGC